jgi:hypothetical protein
LILLSFQFRRNFHRKTYLIKPKEFWPKIVSGLSMELIESKNSNISILEISTIYTLHLLIYTPVKYRE